MNVVSLKILKFARKYHLPTNCRSMHTKPLSVDLNACLTEFCPCGCPYFKPRTILKKIPAILAGELKDKLMPVEFMACEKCGRPHDDTLIEIPKMRPPVAASDNTGQ